MYPCTCTSAPVQQCTRGCWYMHRVLVCGCGSGLQGRCTRGAGSRGGHGGHPLVPVTCTLYLSLHPIPVPVALAPCSPQPIHCALAPLSPCPCCPWPTPLSPVPAPVALSPVPLARSGHPCVLVPGAHYCDGVSIRDSWHWPLTSLGPCGIIGVMGDTD